MFTNTIMTSSNISREDSLLKSNETQRLELVMVDQDTLEPIKVVTTLERFPVPYLMLTDGEQIAQVLWCTQVNSPLS